MNNLIIIKKAAEKRNLINGILNLQSGSVADQKIFWPDYVKIVRPLLEAKTKSELNKHYNSLSKLL